jgi:glycosyltransferase involved in cell wall biosynthesis
MRVVHTVSSLRGGGMEHFVLRLAAAQQQRGHDVAVIAARGGPLVEHAERLGVRAYVLEGSKLARVARAVALMARLRPDVVNAHNPTSMQYAAIGKLVARARFVVTDHAQPEIIRVPSAFEWRLVDAVVAVSQKTAAESHKFGARGPIHVIHNGVTPRAPVRSRAEVRSALDLDDARLVIAQVASFRSLKAQDVTIDAMARLKERGVAVTVLFVGEGEELEAMKARAKALGLGDDRVKFLGFRDDVPDLLGASDVFALPSRTEGLPLAVLEAMAQRLAVVVTPVGGVPELVQDEVDGLVVPVGDADALATAFARLAADPSLRDRLATTGAAKVAKDFTFEGMTDRYEELYRSLTR